MAKRNKLVLSTTLVATALVSHQVVAAKEIETLDNITETKTMQEVSQEDVVAAEAKLQEANQVVKTQEQAVEAAQKEVASAENTVVSETEKVKQAEKIVAEATPATIAQAKEVVKENQLSTQLAEKALAVSQLAKNEAQTAVRQEEKAVAEAQLAVKAKQDEVTQAQAAVAEQEALLHGVNAKEVLEKAEQAQANVAQAHQQVTQAIAALKEAKQADEKRTAELAQATKEVKDAQENLSQLKTALDEANQKVAAAEDDLGESTLFRLLIDSYLESPNTLTLDEEYIQALKEYHQASEDEKHAAREALIQSSRRLSALNTFIVNPIEAVTEEQYDLNHLPEEIREHLSLFAAHLINQIRQQMGTHPTAVSVSSLDLANRLTDSVLRDQWDYLEHGYHTQGILEAIQAYHLAESEDEEDVHYYETWAGFVDTEGASQATITELKKMIYDSLVFLLFPTAEQDSDLLHWEDAISLSGLGEEAEESYLGVDISKVNDHIVVHYIKVGEDQLTEDSTNFETEAKEDSYAPENLERYATEAEQAWNQAIENMTAAETEQSLVEEQHASLEQRIAVLSAKRDKLQQTSDQTPAAQKKLEEAQKNVETSEVANKKAQEMVAQLTADVATKQQALQAAQLQFATKQAELKDLDTRLASQQMSLETKQAALKEAEAHVKASEAELTQAQEKLALSQVYLANLKNAPTRLKEAQKGLKVAQEELAVKEANRNKEQAILSLAKDKQKKLAGKYHQLLRAYQASIEKERLAKIEAEKIAIEQAGGQALPLIDERGNIIGYIDGRKKPSATPIVIKERSTTMSSQSQRVSPQGASSKSLPATGETVSVLGAVGSLALLGLTALPQRKKDN